MILQRWSLPEEGYLPLFMLVSCVISAALLLLVRVQFPAENNTPRAAQAAKAEVTLLGNSESAAGSQTVQNLRFLSKYTLTPPLPPAQIPAQKLVPAVKNSPLAALSPPPLLSKAPFPPTATAALTPRLISLLPPLLNLETFTIDPRPVGRIAFPAEVKPVTPLPPLPAIPTETPLRAGVYHLVLSPRGAVDAVLLLETCGRAEADRTGIALLRKIRFAPTQQQSPLPPSVRARIFWPQTAYSPPSP